MPDEFGLYVILPGGASQEGGETISIPGGEGGTELHGLASALRGYFGKAEKVTEDRVTGTWEATLAALKKMLKDTEETEQTGLRISEMEVSLGISGEGTIGIATVGAEASIKLKFARS